MKAKDDGNLNCKVKDPNRKKFLSAVAMATAFVGITGVTAQNIPNPKRVGAMMRAPSVSKIPSLRPGGGFVGSTGGYRPVTNSSVKPNSILNKPGVNKPIGGSTVTSTTSKPNVSTGSGASVIKPGNVNSLVNKFENMGAGLTGGSKPGSGSSIIKAPSKPVTSPSKPVTSPSKPVTSTPSKPTTSPSKPVTQTQTGSSTGSGGGTTGTQASKPTGSGSATGGSSGSGLSSRPTGSSGGATGTQASKPTGSGSATGGSGGSGLSSKPTGSGGGTTGTQASKPTGSGSATGGSGGSGLSSRPTGSSGGAGSQSTGTQTGKPQGTTNSTGTQTSRPSSPSGNGTGGASSSTGRRNSASLNSTDQQVNERRVSGGGSSSGGKLGKVATILGIASTAAFLGTSIYGIIQGHQSMEMQYQMQKEALEAQKQFEAEKEKKEYDKLAAQLGGTYDPDKGVIHLPNGGQLNVLTGIVTNPDGSWVDQHGNLHLPDGSGGIDKDGNLNINGVGKLDKDGNLILDDNSGFFDKDGNFHASGNIITVRGVSGGAGYGGMYLDTQFGGVKVIDQSGNYGKKAYDLQSYEESIHKASSHSSVEKGIFTAREYDTIVNLILSAKINEKIAKDMQVDGQLTTDQLDEVLNMLQIFNSSGKL